MSIKDKTSDKFKHAVYICLEVYMHGKTMTYWIQQKIKIKNQPEIINTNWEKAWTVQF